MAAHSYSQRPDIRKRGTVDCDMVETTPVVWEDELWRFESVRTNYPGNDLGRRYFRFLHVDSGRTSPPFALDHHFGCAYVEDDTAYAFGVPRVGDQTKETMVDVYRSTDLENWQQAGVVDLPGWHAFNTTVCRANDRYVMAIELGAPPEVVGERFTIRFAESTDLLEWDVVTDDACVFSKDRYTACPALRFVDGFFYMVYLEALEGFAFNPYVVRSPDLADWESSPLNPFMEYDSEEDKQIANPELTEEQRRHIADATNVNNSDVDFCEYRGQTIINYSWGSQKGTEFLAEAVYDGPPEEMLQGFFPEN